jgi:hypothetical protein
MDLIPRIIGDSFSAVDLGYMVAHSEFELLAVNTIARNVLYSCCPNPYPTIRYEFIFRRYATAYVTSIIAPLMYVCVYMCVCVCICMCVYVCIVQCMYRYNVYTHTYTNI